MESATSSHEVLICQTCGDKGFTNAFVYCVKCLGFVIHRYCLNVLPNTYDEFVTWFCEDCKPQIPNLPSSHKLDPSTSQNLNATTSLLVKTNFPKKKRTFKPKRKMRRARLVTRKNKGKQFVSPTSLSFKEFRLIKCVIGLEAPSKGDNKRKRDEGFLDVENKENKIRNVAESFEDSCDSSCTDVNLKNKMGIQDSDITHDKFHLVQNNSENQTPPKGNNVQAEKANQMHNEEEIRADINGVNATVIKKNDGPARPVQDPVWRGSFDITETDYNLFEGLVGHLSDKSCPQVCEEANILPSLLSLEMHSKTALFPPRFLESQPTDNNIALYFFPGLGDRKSEQDFEDLVNDMIDEDLAMRAPAINADLLIFTSTVLPRPFWRFQGKNYLWGVFRAKQNNSSLSVNQDHAISNISNNSENPTLSGTFPHEVTSENEILTKMKRFNSQSPQSPLCNYR